MDTPEQIKGMTLEELIEIDPEELNTAETALWYVKMIKKEIFDAFMKETIKEYKQLFQQVYIERLQSQGSDDERDLYALEKQMIQKKGLQFQLSEWQQY